MVGFAKCVKPCNFAFGGCENVGQKVRPSLMRNEHLLRDEQGFVFCHNGNLLTHFDDICESCGEKYLPYPEETTKEFLAYKCPSCEKVYKTTYG